MVRALARLAAAAAALAAGASIYTQLVGGFRFNLGVVRLSAGSAGRPFRQAIVLALISLALFARDAARRGHWDTVPAAIARGVRDAVARIGRQPLLWSVIAIGAVASVITAHAIAMETEVVGSAAAGSAYGYQRGFDPHILGIVALVSTLACLLLALAHRPPGRHEWVSVGAWILAALVSDALLRSLTPFTFGQIFTAEGANSFYTVTRQYDAGRVIADFDRLRGTWPLHAQSNMPGKLMLFYALERISTDPTVLAWLMVVLSNLGGVFLYLFVRDLFGDKRVALFSLVLYLFVPARIYFFPLFNTVTPVIAFGCALLLLRWLRTGRSIYAVASGVSLYAVVFYEPLPLVLVALFTLIAAGALWRGDLLGSRLAGPDRSPGRHVPRDMGDRPARVRFRSLRVARRRDGPRRGVQCQRTAVVLVLGRPQPVGLPLRRRHLPGGGVLGRPRRKGAGRAPRGAPG